MKTISADFNAMTEAGHVRLTLPCSQEGILMLGLSTGDWIWLTDTELVVGARLAIDDRYGLVGVPDWDTLVHLDDEDTQDFARVQDEFQGIHQRSVRSFDEEWRTFQLLTISEFVAPPELKTGLAPGYFSSRRAEALLMLGKADLALIEIEEARRLGSVEPVRSGCRDLKDRDA